MTRATPSTTRRQALAGMAVLPALAFGAVRSALAQDSRPLQIIVGYPPGGGSDVLARVLSEPLARLLGRPVVVKNVPGAGGQIAATTLLREGGDGLSILAINHPDLFMAVERSAGALKAERFPGHRGGRAGPARVPRQGRLRRSTASRPSSRAPRRSPASSPCR